MVFKSAATVDLPTQDLLSWIFDKPDYDPDRPVYIDAKDESRSISNNQAKTYVRKLAAGFKAAGLKPGDCVMVHGFNDVMYPMAVLGIIAAGCIFTGANPSYTTYELTHHIKAAKVTFILAEPELLARDLEAAKACGVPDANVLVFNVRAEPVPSGRRSWDVLLQHGERDWPRFDDYKTCTTTTCMRLFSSGTTGLPKATIYNHYNLIAQHTCVYEHRKPPYQVIRMLTLPFFHAAMVPVAHTTMLKAGHIGIVLRRFDPAGLLGAVRQFSVTDLPMVPPIAIALLAHQGSAAKDLTSVRWSTCGAAPLDKDLQARCRALLPAEAKLTQVWGMTETSCIATMFYWPEDDETGSVGRLIPGLRAKLIDDDGNDVSAYGTRGELCVQGPSVVEGYFANDEANAGSYDEDANGRWFHTGDIAYCDSATDKWYIVDRKKDLIKVRGFQVAPVELEAVLLSHPGVQEAAVVGITTGPDGAEAPRAYVMKSRHGNESSTTEAELKAYCAGKLAKYKSLDGGVVFLEAVPRNASGKILRKELRARAKAEMQTMRAKL